MEGGKRSFQLQILLFFLLCSVSFVGKVRADARARTVKVICENKLEHNSTVFVPNFIAAMENISQQIRTSGYGLAIVGSGPNANYGLGQCYGDLSSLDCVLCYAEARTVLPNCFPYNGGRIYLDGCFMRAENYTFFNEYKGPEDSIICGNSTRKSNKTFGVAVRQALVGAVNMALGNDGYGKGIVAVSGMNESVYTLADCWKTLDSKACRACLESASRNLTTCLPWSEGRALNTGCFMRYSDTNFLNKESKDGRSKRSVIVIVVSVVSSVVVLVLGITIGLHIWKHRYVQKKRRGSNDVRKLARTLNNSSLNFKYSTLERATGSFDDSNKLGQGGFGTVYKGILPDGREIAIKRLFFNNKHRVADFYNEVNIISSVEHKNLVRLLGCSCSGPESLLVYEFLPNKSLDRFIFDSSKGKALNWGKRFEIIVGTAEGLVYLHEAAKVKIIHRDIKASNILLDWKLRPKIADFGLARSFQDDKSHISTAIAGTLGYMAPEYLAHGQLTEKADVYSFGVLILEIVTGTQNNRSKISDYTDGLVTDMWKRFLKGTVEELYDPNIVMEDNNNDVNFKEEILRVVHVGLLCTQEVPLLRPSMSTALRMLTKEDEELPPPNKPPFIDESTMEFADTCGMLYRHPGGSVSIATVSQSSFKGR